MSSRAAIYGEGATIPAIDTQTNPHVLIILCEILHSVQDDREKDICALLSVAVSLQCSHHEIMALALRRFIVAHRRNLQHAASADSIARREAIAIATRRLRPPLGRKDSHAR